MKLFVASGAVLAAISGGGCPDVEATSSKKINSPVRIALKQLNKNKGATDDLTAMFNGVEEYQREKHYNALMARKEETSEGQTLEERLEKKVKELEEEVWDNRKGSAAVLALENELQSLMKKILQQTVDDFEQQKSDAETEKMAKEKELKELKKKHQRKATPSFRSSSNTTSENSVKLDRLEADINTVESKIGRAKEFAEEFETLRDLDSLSVMQKYIKVKAYKKALEETALSCGFMKPVPAVTHFRERADANEAAYLSTAKINFSPTR